VTTHFVDTSEITVALPPPEAITLFTPEGERSWAGRGSWSPSYPDPSRTLGVGAVFTTHHETRQTIWMIVDQEPDRLRYVRVTPDGLAGTVDVRVHAGSSSSTTVQVTYDLTALTDAAADELAEFAAGYQTEIGTWAIDIAQSLARGQTAPPAAVAVAGDTDRRTAR
jgi:hypothetical protein